MLTLQMNGQQQVAWIEQQIPEPQKGQVIIRTAFSALCGSELGTYRNNGMPQGNTGHEAAGTVIAVGEGVTSPKVGQRVGVSAIAGCGECDYCAKKQFTWCPNRKFYSSMHAEYFVTSAIACHVLPDDLSWEIGVLLTGDGFGVPYHTSTKFISDNVQNVAIFGAGPIGLGNVIMQKYLKRHVLIVDFSKERLTMAKQLGADVCINAADHDVVAAIRAATEGLGADVCIEATGKPDPAKSCFAAVKTGGQVIFNGEQGKVELSISDDFIRRDITGTGSWFYHFGEYEQMLALYREGLPVASLVSDVISYQSAAEAFQQFVQGKTAKVLLRYE
jgi:threonine dehydrogenase-like Zn-dependent dehydrogenase